MELKYPHLNEQAVGKPQNEDMAQQPHVYTRGGRRTSLALFELKVSYALFVQEEDTTSLFSPRNPSSLSTCSGAIYHKHQ